MKSTIKRWLTLCLCGVLVLALTACGGKADSDNGKDKGNAGPIIGENQINAVDYGLDNTGKTDLTLQMVEMHKKGAELGLPIYYPNGTYLFNGTTLDLSSGVEFESMDGVLIRNEVSNTNIINFDDAGNLIGLMHNHLERQCTESGFQVNGNLVSPPLSDADYETKVDFLPYWYNDFGRSCSLTGKFGWKGWYDWRWNHHDIGTTCQAKKTNGDVCGAKLPIVENPYEPPACPECGTQSTTDQYDPDLHPLLGWYRGDDPTVLDWQCYWLQEYGMKQSILIASRLNVDQWEDPKCGTHWVYQLLNNTPNAKQMQFAMQCAASSYDSDEATIRESWWNTFNDFYFNETYRDMVYCYEIDGKRYPVIFLWDEQSLRYSMDNQSANLLPLYKDAAQAFKDNGYDGICILARTSCFANEGGADVRAELAESGVMWFSASYPNNCLGSGKTYEERVNRFLINPDTSCLYGVSTAMNTHTPHPSKWTCPGNTPALFEQWVSNAVKATTSVAERPQMVTCYNISEWSEGGPGLVPTVGQRFGYLEAIRDQIVA